MTVFESKTTINKPVNEIYSFLTDLNNHQQLMPDSISEWKSTKDEASFTIQNMLKLKLKIGSTVDGQVIEIIPAEKPPFELSQTWRLTVVNGDTTTVSLETGAELNMMMKMMASGPLQKLVDYETKSLQNHFA